MKTRLNRVKPNNRIRKDWLTPQPVQKEPETATKVLRKTEVVTRHSPSSFWGFLISLGDFLDKPVSRKTSSFGAFLSLMLKLFLSNPVSMLFCLSISKNFSFFPLCFCLSLYYEDTRKVEFFFYKYKKSRVVSSSKFLERFVCKLGIGYIILRHQWFYIKFFSLSYNFLIFCGLGRVLGDQILLTDCYCSSILLILLEIYGFLIYEKVVQKRDLLIFKISI